MAVESPLLHDGTLTVSTNDLRNGTISGTTRLGPSGSGQYMAVKLSTVNAGVVFPTTANASLGYGILQNKPAVGEVCDVGIFGISKALAGTTTITPGGDLMVDSSGALIPYSSAAGQGRFARQVGATLPAAVGEVFTVAIYGFGLGGGSVA